MAEKWYRTTGRDSDVVISTRVRLARNLKGLPFPRLMSDEQRQKLNMQVKDAVKSSRELSSMDYLELANVPKNELISMVERHIISPDFARDPKGRALLLSPDESISIMIGEEDHLRIQVMKAGLSLDEAWSIADKTDSVLSSKLDYAFSEKLGFLTACPTNLGTAMRASVMIHLPASEKDGSLRRISESISKLGLVIRGMYGEGSGSKAAIYQLSNQETLGVCEKDTLKKLEGIIAQILKIERSGRERLLSSEEVEDSVWRALGILKTARRLSGDEFCSLFSAIRLAVASGRITDISLDRLSELFVNAQPATLMCIEKRDMTAAQRDSVRAAMVRNALN
ncbi:MAG: protein arginine kinase [Clostridia bacterium]|nr:protein arginine kinase [Clostridia bacterium]